MLFGCDVIINFNTAVWADEATHGSLELSRGVIARRYIASGRAPVDILCTIPWDLVAQTLAGADPGDGAGGGAPHAHRAKAARLLRLMTLMRVKRVLDAPDRLMQALRDSTGVSHSATTLASLLLACFLLSHWLACALHLTAITQPSTCSWVNLYFNKLIDDPTGNPCEPLDPPPTTGSVYIAALYWSVMTVTTVGYGDVAPFTDAERCMEIAGMLIGAVGYAVVIGAACGVVAQMSERSRALESALDTAARLGGSQASNSTSPLPAETLARVRGYLRYVHARGAAWAEGDAVALSARLSPALRAEIALARRGDTLRGAHVFVGASAAALAELSSALSLVTLPPGEVLIREDERCDRLSLLRHGVVLTVQSSPARMRHVTVGSAVLTPEHHSHLLDRLKRRSPEAAALPVVRVPVFGVETLWRNPHAAHAALTLTFTELNVITRDRLVSILDRHESLKVSARVHALSCLLVETIRQLGVAHSQIKRSATAAKLKHETMAKLPPRLGANHPPRPASLPPPPPAEAPAPPAPAPASPAPEAATIKVSHSRLAPAFQIGMPLPPLSSSVTVPMPPFSRGAGGVSAPQPVSAAARVALPSSPPSSAAGSASAPPNSGAGNVSTPPPHAGLVAGAAAFSATGSASSARRNAAPSSPSSPVSPMAGDDESMSMDSLREGWKLATSQKQPQLNLTLLMDAVQAGAPELWPGLNRAAMVMQRYCRRWLMRKRLAVIHSYTQISLARGSKPDAAAVLAATNAPGGQAAPADEEVVSAGDVALVEAVSLALTPQLRAIAIAVESLINDVQALRNERA